MASQGTYSPATEAEDAVVKASGASGVKGAVASPDVSVQATDAVSASIVAGGDGRVPARAVSAVSDDAYRAQGHASRAVKAAKAGDAEAQTPPPFAVTQQTQAPAAPTQQAHPSVASTQGAAPIAYARAVAPAGAVAVVSADMPTLAERGLVRGDALPQASQQAQPLASGHGKGTVWAGEAYSPVEVSGTRETPEGAAQQAGSQRQGQAGARQWDAKANRPAAAAPQAAGTHRAGSGALAKGAAAGAGVKGAATGGAGAASTVVGAATSVKDHFVNALDDDDALSGIGTVNAAAKQANSIRRTISGRIRKARGGAQGSRGLQGAMSRKAATRTVAERNLASQVARQQVRSRAVAQGAGKAAGQTAGRAAASGAAKGAAGGAASSGGAAVAGWGGVVLLALAAVFAIALGLFALLSMMAAHNEQRASRIEGLDGVALEVAVYLRGRGLEDLQIAAVMGNIEAESGYTPGAVEGGSGVGFGLCQWSGARRGAIERYADSLGVARDNVQMQMDFLWYEMTGEETNGEGSFGWRRGGFNIDTLRGMGDLEDAVYYFGRRFESPDERYAHWDRRINEAWRVYGALLGGGAIGDGSAAAVVRIAMSGDLFGREPNMCLAWVGDVYDRAGVPAARLPSASHARMRWGNNNNLDAIQPGAMIFSGPFYRSGVWVDGIDAGHVGIYVGDGRVANHIGNATPLVQSLDSWVAWYGFGGWGFPTG